jgi:hypothetical protein
VNKLRKNQMNARVDDETADALKRTAAARGVSAGTLCSQMLTEQVLAQQKSASGIFDEVSQQFDERLAEHDRRLLSQVEVLVKPLKRELTVIKTQIDMLLECVAPERRAEYREGVAKLLTRLQETNGVPR